LVNRTGKIIALKRIEIVILRKSSDESEDTAIAAGNVILPPMIIYKGDKKHEDFMKRAPEDIILAISSKGHIDSEK
jgi:hypothetical protein